MSGSLDDQGKVELHKVDITGKKVQDMLSFLEARYTNKLEAAVFLAFMTGLLAGDHMREHNLPKDGISGFTEVCGVLEAKGFQIGYTGDCDDGHQEREN